MPRKVLRIIHTAKDNVHNIAFWAYVTVKHNKFKEVEMVCIFGIVVLAHEIRKQIVLAGYVQRSKATPVQRRAPGVELVPELSAQLCHASWGDLCLVHDIVHCIGELLQGDKQFA